jgi:hypothetical protein
MNADDFLEKWSPLVGSESAHAYVSWMRCNQIAALLVPVYWAAFLVGRNNVDLRSIGYAAVVLIITIVIWGLRYRARFIRALSSWVGIPIDYRNLPTLRTDRFERWCRRNGLDPHSPRTGNPAWIADPSPQGPSGAFLRTLSVISGALATLCFVGLAVPGVSTTQRPGYAVACVAFGILSWTLMSSARRSHLRQAGQSGQRSHVASPRYTSGPRPQAGSS